MAETPVTNIEKEKKVHTKFINIFIAIATAKLHLAIACLAAFVTSGRSCTSLNLFACSLKSPRISSSRWAKGWGLSLHHSNGG